MADILARQRQIIGSSADWAGNDLTLGDGELALERTPGGILARVGDGTRAFSDAPYLSPPLAAPLAYIGTADVTAAPPDAEAGQFVTAIAAGTVAAGWGEPAAGETVAAGQILAFDAEGRWNVQSPLIDLSGLVTEVDLAGPGGAAGVGFLPVGPGAQVRDVQTRLRDTVHLDDYFYPPEATHDAALDRALAVGRRVLVTSPATINEAHAVPADRWIENSASISGTGRLDTATTGLFVLTGEGKVILTATGGNFGMVRVLGGSAIIRGVRFEGSLSVATRPFACVQVAPTSACELVRVEGCDFRQVRSGVARQAVTAGDVPTVEATPVRRTVLANNTGYDFADGDCIEWNIGFNDGVLLIDGNDFEYVHSADPSLGIAIGVAGKGPYAYVNANRQKRVRVINNRVRSTSHGIHVELGESCEVEGNSVTDCTATYTPGLENLGYLIAGAFGVVFRGNKLWDSPTSAMQIAMGVNAGSTYANSVENNIIEDNYSVGSYGIKTLISRAESIPLSYPATTVIRGNTIIGGRLSHRGVCHLAVVDNLIFPAVGALGFELDYDFREVATAVQNRHHFILEIRGNTVRDKFGRCDRYNGAWGNYRITRLYEATRNWPGHLRVVGGANSFPVDIFGDAGTVSAVWPAPGGRTYRHNATSFPYGVTFAQGDLVCLNNSRICQVTASGSRSAPSDVAVALTSDGVAATDGIIRTANLVWTSTPYHQVGQNVLLSGTGGPMTGTISQIRLRHNASLGWAETVMDLVNPAGGAPLDLTAFGSNTITITAQQEVAYTETPIKAAAPTVTYAAPSGGATIDTQARASLGQLATDLADLRTKLTASGITALEE